MPDSNDSRWLDAAASLAARARPLSRPNPAVGAIVVRAGVVVGRGWTMPGGRPHAEAVALAQAGDAARGATLYVTLEPCAHTSKRGPCCADLVIAAGLARVVVGVEDPDPRTRFKGEDKIKAAGITVDRMRSPEVVNSLIGYLTRAPQTSVMALLDGYINPGRLGRPHVTLKLALSEDGALARAAGESQWLTEEAARHHVHAVRARMDAIVVGGGTYRADAPRLDVRLPGLEQRSPERWLLTRGAVPEGWHHLASLQAIAAIPDCQYLLVEGGADVARAFLAAGLVDQMLLYRAPETVAGNVPRMPELTEAALSTSLQWQRTDQRTLGKDRLDIYERNPCSPE